MRLDPPPPYTAEESPPPYTAGELPPPYAAEEPPPPYAAEEPPPPYAAEEPPPPYAAEESPPPYASIDPLEDFKVFVDYMSGGYVDGSEVDYVDSLMGAGFTVNNPNAVSSCGCGHSFKTAKVVTIVSPRVAGVVTKPFVLNKTIKIDRDKADTIRFFSILFSFIPFLRAPSLCFLLLTLSYPSFLIRLSARHISSSLIS